MEFVYLLYQKLCRILTIQFKDNNLLKFDFFELLYIFSFTKKYANYSKVIAIFATCLRQCLAP